MAVMLISRSMCVTRYVFTDRSIVADTHCKYESFYPDEDKMLFFNYTHGRTIIILVIHKCVAKWWSRQFSCLAGFYGFMLISDYRAAEFRRFRSARASTCTTYHRYYSFVRHVERAEGVSFDLHRRYPRTPNERIVALWTHLVEPEVPELIDYLPVTSAFPHFRY